MIDQDTRLQIFKKDRTGCEDIALSVGNPILEEIDEFADCVRTGKKPETDGQGALHALGLVRAAIESARSGKQARIVI
jgi:predicted dehydrogenase